MESFLEDSNELLGPKLITLDSIHHWTLVIWLKLTHILNMDSAFLEDLS